MTSPRRPLLRPHLLVPALLAAILLALAWWQTPGTVTHHRKPVTPPAQFFAPAWQRLLGGDQTLTPASYARLASYHPGLPSQTAAALAAAAGRVLTADLTNVGRAQWPGYWPPPTTTTTPAPVRCTDVRILAGSPAVLPVKDAAAGTWVKTLLAYTGHCGNTRYTAAGPAVDYVYLHQVSATRWLPVREWNIPADPVPAPAQVAPWQLSDLTCPSSDGTVYRLRTFAAEAFDKMCADARADGVVLVPASGYRTRAQQAALFQSAVKAYGSAAEARKWVAYANDRVCESKHCEGTAVDVEPDHAALSWLWTVVGCSTGQQLTKATSCPAGQTPVRRMQAYGFVAPYARIPGYMEFTLPLGDGSSAPPNCRPTGEDVDVMVASIFRCRLGQAGVPPAQTAQVVAQALVVSKCASGWNATARVFAGRYATEPNPTDGRVYSEAGVFMLRRQLARTGWVRGSVLDPVANINAAASLWLATRGWEQFPCATGTDPGIDVGPVLPAYGGPQIPAWATRY